ncbi:hypothetical protein ACJX0J_003553 (mitochondrion) [Zea mays]
MVTTVKEPVLEIENISDPFIGISIYEQRKEGMNHLTSSGQEARATFQNRVLKYILGQWKKALYAFHPEEGLIARYRLSRVMKGASTILIEKKDSQVPCLIGNLDIFFLAGSDDANLYFLAWLYFIDRGVSGRASAFNQTGTGQDEKQIGGPVLGATTIGRNQEWFTWQEILILGCNLIMSEFVDHAIEDFVRNIEFTLSFLQPILWNLFFQHMSSLE